LLVHLVLLHVAVEGCCSLGELSVFKRYKLFLVFQRLPNIGVVHLFVLDHAAEVVLVVSLRSAWADLVPEL